MKLSCLASIVFRILYIGSGCADSYERSLFKHLMQNYSKLERPVVNNSLAVEVNLQIILQQIVDVDEKNQVVEANIWLKFEWWDYNLKWDPELFGGVQDIRFPTGNLWKPDVLLMNSVHDTFDSTYPSNMIVYSSGTVSWIPPGIVTISCSIDITWFPFDDQVCYFMLGSWTYSSNKLNLTPYVDPADNLTKPFDITEYLENGEWSLLDTPVEVITRIQEGEEYVTLLYKFHIRRRTLYYSFNIIMPSLLISMITLLGFILPVESGEKMTLEITILLSICVFLTMVSNATPPTSEAVPLLGVLFSFHMIVVSASVVFSVIVLNLHYRTPETHHMSKMLRKILLDWLPRLLNVKRPLRKCAAAFDGLDEKYMEDFDSRIDQCLTKLVVNGSANNSCGLDDGYKAVLATMQLVHNDVRFITRNMKKHDDAEDVKNDWKFAARVVDRLCLYVFALFIIGGTCSILLSIPFLKKEYPVAN